jgi:dTDP-4-amino-4,6-dideoxygalactose transaminase
MRKLSKDEREELREALREAAYHLAACWDALLTAEAITETEIQTEAIEGLASDCATPATYPELDDERLECIIEELADV